MIRRLKAPEFTPPALGKDEAEAELSALLVEAEREAAKARRRVDPRDRHGVAARFFASERYLGPLTAGSIAWWLRENVLILPKTGGLVPLTLNEIQYDLLVDLVADLVAGVPVRFIVLKARQFGISTMIAGLLFFLAHRLPSYGGAVVCHKDDATQNMLAMLGRAIDNARFQLRVEERNSKMVHFAKPSDVRISYATAEAGEVKRSYTLQWLHLSEVAFWTKPDKTDLGLMQALPDEPWTLCVKESTANGVGNLFWRQYWDAADGRSSYRARFYPWFLHPSYRKADCGGVDMDRLDEEERVLVAQHGVDREQLAWRRATIADKCDGDVRKFHQEYPSTAREAFLTTGRPVFDLDLVEQRAAEAKLEPLAFRGSLVYTDDDQRTR